MQTGAFLERALSYLSELAFVIECDLCQLLAPNERLSPNALEVLRERNFPEPAFLETVFANLFHTGKQQLLERGT